MPDGYDMQLARDLLAKRIMECALEHGERDPEKMKICALDGFKAHRASEVQQRQAAPADRGTDPAPAH